MTRIKPVINEELVDYIIREIDISDTEDDEFEVNIEFDVPDKLHCIGNFLKDGEGEQVIPGTSLTDSRQEGYISFTFHEFILDCPATRGLLESLKELKEYKHNYGHHSPISSLWASMYSLSLFWS